MEEITSEGDITQKLEKTVPGYEFPEGFVSEGNRHQDCHETRHEDYFTEGYEKDVEMVAVFLAVTAPLENVVES